LRHGQRLDAKAVKQATVSRSPDQPGFFRKSCR
jgi:hypothetical protein